MVMFEMRTDGDEMVIAGLFFSVVTSIMVVVGSSPLRVISFDMVNDC